jgi:hypothetical protein
MINEEITQKDINLAVRVGSLAYGELKKALEKLIAKLTEEKPESLDKPELKHGKQTLKQLQKHNEGLSIIELKDPNLRQLYHAMKKDGIDFAAVKDGKGKYTLFFKGRDADTMTHAFKRYAQKLVKLSHKKPSIEKALAAAKKVAQTLESGRNKEKKRDKGAR